MTYEALIRIAPETSADRLNDPRREGRTLYDTSQLKIMPAKKTIPLLCNHDPERVVGTVTQLMRLDVDGYWTCAVATLETCPTWLKRGTRASFSFYPLQMDSFGNNIVRSAMVKEVSVLTDGVEPYEPDAMVLYVKPTETLKSKLDADIDELMRLKRINANLERLGIPGNLKPLRATPAPRSPTTAEIHSDRTAAGDTLLPSGGTIRRVFRPPTITIR